MEGEKKSCRFDWHQTPSTVSLSIFAKVAVPEKCSITVNRVRCVVKIVFDGGMSLFEKDLVLREVGYVMFYWIINGRRNV